MCKLIFTLDAPLVVETTSPKKRLVGIYATKKDRGGGPGIKPILDWIDEQEDVEQRFRSTKPPHYVGRLVVSFLFVIFSLGALAWGYGFWPDNSKTASNATDSTRSASAEANEVPPASDIPLADEAQQRGGTVGPPPEGEPIRPIPDEPLPEDRPPFLKRGTSRENEIRK